MIVLTFEITLREPVIVTMLDGEPNSKVSLNYLPGTALRGALITAWMRGKQSDIASDSLARTLFFNGTTRFLNGYPVHQGTSNRSLPVPRSWQTRKGVIDAIHDFAHPDFVLDEEAQWSHVKAPFRTHYTESSNSIRTLASEFLVTTHTTRSRIKGRATSAEGELFRYVSLAAGQTFKAHVLLDADAATPEGATYQQILLSHLPKVVRLGGSRNAGYGRVCIDNVSVERADQATPWREFDLPLPEATVTQVVVTLLSDVLLRNDAGQTCVDVEVMEAALEKKLPGAKVHAASSASRCAFMDEIVVGGFNRHWGLPLAQQQAFAMGSVFLVTLPAADPIAIERLENEGLGERRAEGFGRVGVCTLPYTEWEADKDTIALSKTPAALTSNGQQTLRDMATRFVRTELDRLVLHDIQTYKIENAPSGSQIGRLRGVVQQELLKVRRAEEGQTNDPPKLANITQFLDDLRERASDQYRDAKIDNSSLAKWLKDRLSQASSYHDGSLQRTKIGGQESDLTEDGRIKPLVSQEYTLRLIDGVLAHAAKER